MPRALRLATISAALTLAIAGTAVGQSAQPAPRKSPPKAKPAAKPVEPAAPPAQPAPAPPPPATDVKIVTSFSQGAQVSQNTTLIKGPRQRVEFPGLVSIDQCDLQRTVLLNPAAKRYRVQPYAGTNDEGANRAASAPPPAAPSPAGQPPRGGVVTFTTTLTDTLERQTFFGLEARHIKIVMTKQADANACDKAPMRTETDAWFVDLPGRSSSCARASAPKPEPPASTGECRDRVETRVVGDVAMGFPIKSVVATVTGDNEKDQHETTSAIEVTALEITRLDQSLFEVPPDYVAAASSAELVPALAAGGSLQDALFGSTADGSGRAAPKKNGVVRVGVLEPIDKSGRNLNTKLLRQELTGKFSMKPYEALPLSGSSADAIEADAKRLECDYLLLAEVAEVKTSKPGKVGGLLKAASGGGPPKDQQDVKASYRLFAVGAPAAPRAAGDVKASSGGGFGFGNALRLASFAGQMYMGFGMMRGFGGLGGFGLGLDPVSAMASSGGLGSMGGGFFDPRAMAMSSMAMSVGASGFGANMMPNQADAQMYQTIGDAFDAVAKSAVTKIGASK